MSCFGQPLVSVAAAMIMEPPCRKLVDSNIRLFSIESFTLANPIKEDDAMTVARVTEISATSNKSFEDAIRDGVDRATKTLDNVKSAWVKEQEVVVTNDEIAEYKVNMKVTFVLKD